MDVNKLKNTTDRYIHTQWPPQETPQVAARICRYCGMDMFSHEGLTADDGNQSHKLCYELDEGGEL